MTTLIAVLVTLIGFSLAFRGLKKPGILLGLLWGIYAFEQVVQQGVPIFAQRPWITNVVLTGLAGIAVVRAFLEKKLSSYRFNLGHALAISLFLLACFSYFWSISPSDTIFHLKKNAPYIIAFAAIAPLCGFNAKQVELATSTVLYFGAFVLFGLSIGSYGSRGLEIQINGQFVEANPLAAASFGGYVSICSIFHMYKTSSKDQALLILHIFICLLGLYVIVRSGSRGQLLAVVLATGIWLPITAKVATRKSSIIAIVIVAIVGFGAIQLVQQVNSSRWRDDLVEDATSGRIEQTSFLIQEAFKAGPQHIFFGLGSSASYQVLGGYPHNVPGEVVAEEGLVGFSLFLGFLCYVTASGVKAMRSKSITKSFGAEVGMLLALFTFDFGLCLKQGSLLSTSRLFCVGFCILSAVNNKRSNSDRQMLPRGIHPQDTRSQ